MRLGGAGAQDGQFAVKGGIVHPVIQAAPLQRVMNLARAVRGQDHDGGFSGLDRAKFGDRHLKIRQGLQQERLERLVRAVQLVDQQDRRAPVLRLHRLQQGPGDQVFLGEKLGLQRATVGPARGFCRADGDHLGGKVPLGHRTGGIQTFVALQPDQAAAKARGDGLGDLGLAHAGLAFQKQRTAKAQGQEDHRRQRP